MSKLFKLLSFLITWGGSLAVLYINHIVLVEEGTELDMFGFLVTIIIVLSFVNWVDGRVKVWDIQNRYKLFRIAWSSGKRILIAGGFTYLLFSIENNLPKLQTSALLITMCFVVGFVLSILAEIKIKKGTQ